MAQRHRFDADYATDEELKAIEAELIADLDSVTPEQRAEPFALNDEELPEHVELPTDPEGTIVTIIGRKS